MRLQIHANVRIRRIYFADRLYTDDEMPNEFKMFLPSGKKDTKEKEEEKPKEEAKSHKSIEGEKSEVEKLDMGEEAEPSGAPPTPVHEEASSHGEGNKSILKNILNITPFCLNACCHSRSAGPF